MITRKQFDVLNAVYKCPGATQRQIAESIGISLGAVNATIGELANLGCVDDSLAITSVGLEALEPYRVENAVIMAAGLSSRFAPISYERPKGVLTVRGEVLVERQIRQLREAGVQDITLVVGYKKEEFFYLEDLLGVRIVVNEEYASRNNNSTLYLVRERLGNTYICSSDDYFVRNPFETYVYRAYYAAVYFEGETDEYLLQTKGKDGLIVSVSVGGCNAFGMMGHAYFDRTFSKAFVRILENEYDRPETAGKLWEDIFREHISELPMVMRSYGPGEIYEFDSLDDLREFDPDFIENVDSAAFDNICATLGCTRGQIQSIEPIKQGLTNLSCRFVVDGSSYVYRHPGSGTEEIISRESETASQRIAADLGIDRTFIYEDPEVGWKISHFVDRAHELDYSDWSQVSEAMSLARRLHSSGKVTRWTFDVYGRAMDIVGFLTDSRTAVFRDFPKLLELASDLHDAVSSDEVALCLCHNDMYAPNFLVSDEGIQLIDWEYSACSDYASDLGTFICCSPYDVEDAQRVLSMYFEREPSKAELRHCLAYVGLCSFYWFVWALYKESQGETVGEWLYLWYKGAKHFGLYALRLYE